MAEAKWSFVEHWVGMRRPAVLLSIGASLTATIVAAIFVKGIGVGYWYGLTISGVSTMINVFLAVLCFSDRRATASGPPIADPFVATRPKHVQQINTHVSETA